MASITVPDSRPDVSGATSESFATEEEVFAAWFGDTDCPGHDCPGCPECDPAGDGDNFGAPDSWPDWTDEVSPRLRESGVA